MWNWMAVWIHQIAQNTMLDYIKIRYSVILLDDGNFECISYVITIVNNECIDHILDDWYRVFTANHRWCWVVFNGTTSEQWHNMNLWNNGLEFNSNHIYCTFQKNPLCYLKYLEGIINILYFIIKIKCLKIIFLSKNGHNLFSEGDVWYIRSLISDWHNLFSEGDVMIYTGFLCVRL
jgi:hypothetical protein